MPYSVFHIYTACAGSGYPRRVVIVEAVKADLPWVEGQYLILSESDSDTTRVERMRFQGPSGLDAEAAGFTAAVVAEFLAESAEMQLNSDGGQQWLAAQASKDPPQYLLKIGDIGVLFRWLIRHTDNRAFRDLAEKVATEELAKLIRDARGLRVQCLPASE